MRQAITFIADGFSPPTSRTFSTSGPHLLKLKQGAGHAVLAAAIPRFSSELSQRFSVGG